MAGRVLHAVSQFLPRSETFVYTLVAGHRAFDASVLCQSIENESEFPFPRVFVQAKPQQRRLPSWWWSASVTRVSGRSPWRRAVERFIVDAAPDVVHAHFGPVGCDMVSVCRDLGLPLVTSLYGVDAAVLPYLPQWRDRYRRLFAGGDLFLAEGPEMLKKVVAAGAPADRTVLQPISLDLTKYPTWEPVDAPTVLFVGRFIEKKGLLDAIAAFARAHSRVPAARLVVIGGGPDESDAQRAVRALGIENAVEFAGLQPHATVIRRLQQATVLIHPSCVATDGDSEGGAPTILLEAQAIGTPIVTTLHADIPNVVPRGPGVSLVPEHDIEALTEALVAALKCRTPSSSRHVVEHHDIRRNIIQLEARYTHVSQRRAAV